MKVIICGAGQVGYGIAERLSADDNDVTVIDKSPELIQRVNDMLDVRGIVGHGSHPDVLEAAGAHDASMIIAVTLHDEVNMVACQVAGSLFDIETKIARVRAQEYLNPTWNDLFSRNSLPIDVVISPEIEVGEMVMRRLSQPGAFETIAFGEGRTSLVGVTCSENCPIVNTPLRQLTDLFPDLDSVIVAVLRNTTLFVPHSDDQLNVGDDVYFLGRTEQVPRTLKIFGHDEQRAQRILIAGGGNIGLYVALAIEARHPTMRIKVLERDHTRAVTIAEQLNRTVVLHGDVLNEELLREAGAAQADAILALTNDEQANILSCVLAKQLGCQTSMCLYNSRGYAKVIRSLGIDAHVNPRATTVSRVLQHVRRGRIKAVHTLQNGAGEVIEGIALETSALVGKPLRQLDLPDGVRIGAVLRGDQYILPDGMTQIEAGDRVIVFALAAHVRTVEGFFRVNVEFIG